MTSRRTEVVMGMPFTLCVSGTEQPGVFDDVFADLRRTDALFSPFRPESAVCRMNGGQLARKDADPLVREVDALCAAYEQRTDGYFCAWPEGRFDPTGLVKGWAIARACAILERAGHTDYFVDGAGDVRTRGERAPGLPWRVGIRHPVERDRVTLVLEAFDLAVATSGTYEKGPHIRDPHTGRAVTELISLTVIGPDILAADVYATAAFAMGKAGVAFVDRLPEYEAYAIDRSLAATWTPGFSRYVAEAEAAPVS